MVLGKLDSCKRIKLEHFLTAYTKINSKWLKDLNVKPEAIKLRGKHRQNTLNDINQLLFLNTFASNSKPVFFLK